MLYARLRMIGILLLLTTFSFAEDLEISGKVLNIETGGPLEGALVVVIGTTVSTSTDDFGMFSLKVAGGNEVTLEFSKLGFSKMEMKVSGSSSDIQVEMAEASMDFSEEVIATGFATSVKRRNLANSIASLSSEELIRAPTQTLDGTLSGKFTGVTVSQNTGAPGGGISVNLRGVSTLIGQTQPLFVVDGVIVNNSQIQSGVNEITAAAAAGSSRPQDQPSNRIADLIPSDIESMEILKGPSAAAIYGAKASNGVVIITTKKGKSGETVYNFSQSMGSRSITKKLGVREFTAETALENNGQQGLDIYNEGNYVDYEEEIYGNTGSIFQTLFSGSGGTDYTSYYFSASALTDEGIVKRTGYDKYSFRMNLDHTFNESLDIKLRSTFINSKARRGLTGNDNTGTTFGVAISATPSYWDGRPVNGVYPDNPFAGSNPIQTRDLMKNEETVNRTITSAILNWNLYESDTQILDFQITGGVDYFSMEGDARFPNELQFEQASDQPGTVILSETEATASQLYFNLTHTYYTSGGNSFTTTGGLQFEGRDINTVTVIGNDLIEGQFNLDQAASVNVAHNRLIQRDRGFFVQTEAHVGEALFFTAGLRGDSSSANGDEDKTYLFPKASFSGRLSEYEFWSPFKDFMTEFKVRLAYGETGNLPIARAKFSAFVSENIDGSGGLLPGQTRGNPDIEPETSKEIEFGIDGTIRNGKASFEFSYFNQKIADLLLERDLPSSSGFTEEIINGGEMEIKGLEFALFLDVYRSDDFSWDLGINYFSFDSMITQMDVDPFTDGGFADFLGNFLISEGFAPTTIIGAQRDANGDFIVLGDAAPDFQIGWENYLTYKNWTFTSVLDWKEGGDVINLTVLLSDLGGTTADLDTNPDAPDRLGNITTDTTPWVQDGTYIKLREVRLEYDVSEGFLNRALRGLSHMKLSISGRNLWTETDYGGYDPEVSNFGSVAIGSSVDVTPFPSSKSLFFTVSIGM